MIEQETNAQQQAHGTVEVRPVEATGLAAYSPQQQLALTRYTRLQMMRRNVLPTLDPEDWQARLIYKALYSTYQDCEDLGLGTEVKLLRERAGA